MGRQGLDATARLVHFRAAAEAEHARDVRPVDIGIKQPDSQALTGEGDG